MGIPGFARRGRVDHSLLVQEQPGFRLGITPELGATGRHAAQIAREKYEHWLANAWSDTGKQFRRDHFTIAVGGGNTVKSEYKALLAEHARDIDWLAHVRFFVLEESCNEPGWRSARDGLASSFIKPLAKVLIGAHGRYFVTQKLDMAPTSPHREIVKRMLQVMLFPIDMRTVKAALRRGKRAAALDMAKREANRYQRLLCEYLGPEMSVHLIISGISKEGGIGAFTTYTPQLKQKAPAVIVLEKANGAVSVALNRGYLTGADCISLIISGNLKLKALGRFEMEENIGFEQTVMETPIRMLRETRDIAEKVYIFADDKALHFEEGQFRYREDGHTVSVKSEVREGEEEGGIHMLLVHGFMGLYTYINLLIRLPSAWKVSALRRGNYAKKLPNDKVFPHYARALRKIILHNWRQTRPAPICCHSMAGVISDHLLISVLDDYRDELPEFDDLATEDRQLIEALRAGGVFHIATWAPSDSLHIKRNFETMQAHKRRGEALDYSGPESVYRLAANGRLKLNGEHRDGLVGSPAALEMIMKFWTTEKLVNAMTVGVRTFLRRKGMQKLMSNQDAPYGQRILSARVLEKVSFYGVLKEMTAATHDPRGYQDRHLKALEAIIKYDIPYLAIIHRDDFMVSANRHIQENKYLMAQRVKKEGVKHKEDLRIPVRLVLLDRGEEELAVDPINPHFLILSTTHGSDDNARAVTSAITRFVNENVARAVQDGTMEPLASVTKWAREHQVPCTSPGRVKDA